MATRLQRAFSKQLIAGLVIGFVSSMAATTYHVSPTGSDTRNDGSSRAPWEHIAHAANQMTAGDVCMIHAGIYRETVSGMPPNTTFQAYPGEVVTISGAEPVTGWRREDPVNSPNVYYVDLGWTLGDGNQVFQGQGTQASLAMKPEARWPNAIDTDGTDYPWQNSRLPHPTNNEVGDWSYANATIPDAGPNAWLTDLQLPKRADGYWIGARMHIMSGYGWILAHPTVTAYDDALKKLTTDDQAQGGKKAYQFSPGNEYYLTGKRGELDSPGEWFIDSTNSRLYFYSTTEPAHIEVKKRSVGFDVSGKTHISLGHLQFFGCTIRTDRESTHGTYDGLTMRYLNHSSANAAAWGFTLQSNSVLRNSELSFDSRGLLQLEGNDIRVINNHLHDSGYNPTWGGMLNVNPSSTGAASSRILISHNTLNDAGRNTIGKVGRDALVEFNDMYNAMKIATDGAVFYAFGEAGNSVVRYNLIHDAQGAIGHTGASVFGFYLDCQNSNWMVHHNLIWSVAGYAIQLNAWHNFDMFFNNTSWNATKGGIRSDGHGDGESGTHIHNNLFSAPPVGNKTTWQRTDARYNLYTDPQFVDPANGNFALAPGSPAIDAGVVIPGITDGFIGSAPDLGALERGAASWVPSVGWKPAPPSPDPVYSLPQQVFANQMKDGSFESGKLDPYWNLAQGSAVRLLNGDAWTDKLHRIRTGYYSAEFGRGTSELRQVVTGLLPNRSYEFFVAVEKKDVAAAVKVGVRNYGGEVPREITVPATGDWDFHFPTAERRMFDQSFTTGPAATSAEIYINVVSTTDAAVYVDDLAVELSDVTAGPPPSPKPPATEAATTPCPALLAKPATHGIAEAQARELMQAMTPAERFDFVCGTGLGIRGVPRLGIPPLNFCDASAGLRIIKVEGCDTPEKTTAFPCTLLLAATWNPALAERYAAAIAEEFRAADKHFILGPGMNLYRTAKDGRNFEFLGEDPILAGRLVAAYVRGAQGINVATTLKHFIANETEDQRRGSNSVVDERTLHEVYMRPFQAGIEAGAWAVMTSYNLVNGEWAAQSGFVVNQLLRHDLKFDGLVMTDWDSSWDGVKLSRAGVDLEMSKGKALIFDRERVLATPEINEMVVNVLKTGIFSGIYELAAKREFGNPELLEKLPAHCDLALEVNHAGIVLLKNRGLLPLEMKPKGPILVTGNSATRQELSGGGSAHVMGYDLETYLDVARQTFGRDHVTYAESPDDEQIRSAALVLVFTGRPQKGDYSESENRNHPFELPEDTFIGRCTRLNPATVVTLICGGGARMDWADDTAALLLAPYGGQTGPAALFDIVTGKVNPSGRLPFTIERQFADSCAAQDDNVAKPGPSHTDPVDLARRIAGRFESDIVKSADGKERYTYDLPYNEGVFTGYRWYDQQKIAPRFPFGFGLSYTTFGYSDLKMLPGGTRDAPSLTITFTVTNTGARAGEEVSQVYLSNRSPRLLHPVRELKGFAHTPLDPGESKVVSITLNSDAFSSWQPTSRAWTVDPGPFNVEVAVSARDIKLAGPVTF